MRRVKVLRRPEVEGHPVDLAELVPEREEGAEREEMLYFRHRCDEEWYAALIAEGGVKGKKITPARLRKLIVMALQKRREEME